MVAPATLVLAWALVSSALAAVVPWLQREDEVEVGWERKTLFGMLVADAAFHWLALTAVGQARPGASWIGSYAVLMVGGLILAGRFLLRGFELPPLLRWGGVAATGLVEPVLLTLSFLATRG